MVPPLNTINMQPDLSFFLTGGSGNWGKKKKGGMGDMKLAVFLKMHLNFRV